MTNRAINYRIAVASSNNSSVKGSEQGQAITTTKRQAGKGGRRKVDFAVPHLWYGEVQAWLTSPPENKGKKRGGEMLVLARPGLPSYLCRLPTLCVDLSVLGVVSTPPQ
jgi:hypothetical protein